MAEATNAIREQNFLFQKMCDFSRLDFVLPAFQRGEEHLWQKVILESRTIYGFGRAVYICRSGVNTRKRFAVCWDDGFVWCRVYQCSMGFLSNDPITVAHMNYSELLANLLSDLTNAKTNSKKMVKVSGTVVWLEESIEKPFQAYCKNDFYLKVLLTASAVQDLKSWKPN